MRLGCDGRATGARGEAKAWSSGGALDLAGRTHRLGTAAVPELMALLAGAVVARRGRTCRALLSTLGLAATPKGTARVAMWALQRATKSVYHPWGSADVGGRTRTGQNNWWLSAKPGARGRCNSRGVNHSCSSSSCTACCCNFLVNPAKAPDRCVAVVGQSWPWSTSQRISNATLDSHSATWSVCWRCRWPRTQRWRRVSWVARSWRGRSCGI